MVLGAWQGPLECRQVGRFSGSTRPSACLAGAYPYRRSGPHFSGICASLSARRPGAGRMKVRIAVMGSGGVGGFFGGRLVRGGAADVTFIARGAHLAAMREHGLAIEGTNDAE